MSRSKTLAPVLAVAEWEFGRYFKLRDQLIAFLSLIIGGCVGIGAVKISRANSEVKVAIQGTELPIQLAKDSNIKLTASSDSLDQLKRQVLDKEIDAVLIAHAETATPTSTQSNDNAAEVSPSMNSSFELFVRNDPAWLDELRFPLNQWHTQQAITRTGMNAQQLASVFAPVELTVTNVNDRTTNKLDQLIAMLLLMMVILTSWLGLAYFLSGITGEKQQRVTEQIVSAISPQSWIDGKLLGITAASMASVGNLMLTGAVSFGIATWAGMSMPLPESAMRVSLIAITLIYGLGGVLMWNCFYAAIATIINAPNTSSRSSLMFVPVLPMATAAFAMNKPDGTWMQVLSIFPGSSATAMPIRLLMSEVPVWELALSLSALIVSIGLLRLLAGRIFQAGILLVGKEPTWFEIVTWSVKGSERSTLS